MSEPFISEIRPFAFNFAPKGWALCLGQTLAINQNQALFALIGTTYGGNGVQTFMLPNLGGRVPVGAGQGAGLRPYALGEVGGISATTLSLNQIPAHSHGLAVTTNAGTASAPTNAIPAAPTRALYSSPPDSAMAPDAVGQRGGSAPHNNFMPSLGTSYCIALVGIFPTRN